MSDPLSPVRSSVTQFPTRGGRNQTAGQRGAGRPSPPAQPGAANPGTLGAMDWNTLTTGEDPRARLAPEAMLALTALNTTVWGAAAPELLELARIRIAMLLRNPEAIERRPSGAPRLP